MFGNILRLFAIILIVVFNSSMTGPRRVGILTDDFGVVTKDDLDEEERRAYPVPLTLEPSLAFQYWQCLPTENVLLKCDAWDIYDPDVKNPRGNEIFQIRIGNEVENFFVRHGQELKECEEMLDEWREVMNGEDIVCISGENAGTEPKHFEDGSLVNFRSWQIDRMKSRHGEWSWFDRRPEAERQANEKVIDDEYEVPNQYADDADFTGAEAPNNE